MGTNEGSMELSVPMEIKHDVSIYQGASTLTVTADEQEKLLASFDDKLIEIRPDGMIFLPQAFWRKRLNETFGIGQWCLLEVGSHKDPTKDKLYLKGSLLVRGCFVALAVGEAELHSNNPNQSWASTWESAKSDCITRCCKDLGIASELWQPTFIRNWIEANALAVFIETEYQGKKSKKKVWRKKTAKAFWNETGIVPGQQSAPPQPAPAQQPAPAENPFVKHYTDAKAVEAVLAIAKTKGDLNALYKNNDKLVRDSDELAAKFKAKEREFKASQGTPAPAAEQKIGRGKKELSPENLQSIVARLEAGDISAHALAFIHFNITPAQKQILDDAYKAANEFEVRIRVKYHKPDDIEILLGLCTNAGQVRAMHEANANLIDKDAFLTQKLNERLRELKNAEKK